ncbi:MAG TPA: ATP synthase subunit I [Acidothermaceae bacterium]
MDETRTVRYVVGAPRRVFVVAMVLGGVGLAAASIGGHWLVGLLFVVGLFLGAVHNTMTATSIRKATTAGGDPDKRAFAFSSLFRLLYITVFAAIFLVVFHRAGLAVFVGLLVFHFLALVGTGVPLIKELKKG